MSILKELQNKLPEDAQITEVKFEGSEIVLYTKNEKFFRESEDFIKSIVHGIKKRIEVRPDLTIVKNEEETREIIMKDVPEEAKIEAIYFEPEMGKVVIEARKPGLVIGKGGMTYRALRDKTLWLPKIERAPAIDSKIVRAVRNLLHSEIEYRKSFLNRVGQKINTKTIGEDDRKGEWIRLTTLGGFRQVGRSCLLLSTPYSRVLMDCGVNVGAGGKDALPFFEIPEFDIEKLDAVILSHAHLDHSGMIPYLYHLGYKGPIYMTPPTRDLMVLLSMDYIDVCQKNGANIMYNKKAVEKAVTHSVTLGYGEVSDITEDIRLTFQPAGHLLGSAMVHLHIGNGLHNMVYSADFKFGPSRLFDPAYKDFSRVETMIMETTYGAAGDIVPKRHEVEAQFYDLITRTMQQGGKVLIPVFGVGRGQEIMVMLANMADGKKFEHPVHLEGMIRDATAIHTAYPEYLSSYLQKKIFHYGENPFLSDIFHQVVPKDRDAIIDSPDPCVILATSGMLIGGPSVEYLKALAADKRNLLLFVGYQGEYTLGGKIQRGWKEIPIRSEGGKTRVLKMEMGVESIRGLSGHSGRNQLMGYLYNMAGKPERILMNHGEEKKSIEFARDVRKVFHVDTLVPANLETVRLH